MDVSRWLPWPLLAAPLAVQTWRYAAETVYYGEYLHWTGEQSARLLILTLAVKGLHRWIYAGALLTFLHWIATAFDPTAGYVHLGVVLVVLALRAWPLRAARRA